MSMSFFTKRVDSFRHAFRGIGTLVLTQVNARIHLVITLAGVSLGWAESLDRTDWCLLAFSLAIVWMAEALNTAIELLVDAAFPERHPLVGQAKDVAAAPCSCPPPVRLSWVSSSSEGGG
jgi:diacylglycerol kinase (ATP)